MSRYFSKDELESPFHTDDVVALQTSLGRGTRAYYRRELLTQQSILQNTLDKLFSETLPNELQDDADVVKLWNDLNESLLLGPRGPRTKAGRRLNEYLGDDFSDFAALVEDLKGLLKHISSLIKTGFDESIVSQAKGGGSFATQETLRLERRQNRNTSLENEDLDKILSNIRKSRARVLRVAALYQESFARGRSDNDTASVTSVETESTSGEPALSFLPVSLSPTLSGPDLSEKALLDTGATASCVSEELASNLGLITKPSDNEVVWTASQEQKIFHNGETRLRFSWKNKSGKIERVKLIAYVVPGLALPLILSHDFTKNHPNVWDVADTTGVLLERVAVLGFGRLSKEQGAAEKTFEQDHTQVNRDKDREMTDAERVELEKRLGISASNSSARSGIDTSSTTESQSSTNGRSR